LRKNYEFEAGIKFYANTAFGEQQKRQEDDRVDEDGPFAIPNIKSFWCIMNKRGIYMLSSRHDELTKFHHFTSFENLKIGKNGSGATKDLGQFDEGYCTQVNAIDQTLVICFQSNRFQTAFMAMVSAYAGKMAFQQNENVDFQAQLGERDSAVLSDYPLLGPNGKPISMEINPSVGNLSRHSYWRLLANWGQCSVACGGGTATR